MSELRDWLAGVLLASCALSAHGAERAPPKSSAKVAAPDLEFLEYLGTLESDEDNWTDAVNVQLPVQMKPKNGASKDKPKAEVAAKSTASVEK